MLVNTPTLTLRPPSTVMRLDRMGSFHQSRLSFMRCLLRTFKKDKWGFAKPVWRIDKKGTGTAVYTATDAQHTYSLIAFAHDIPDEMRSDRVIATAWDATFCLYDGIPDENDLQRLHRNVPLQEAGRITSSELCLARANRSVRLWQYVIDCLATGNQPELDKVLEVGYLMRTTAVYGSGKFGALDRTFLLHRPFVQSPFALEMLAVYLIRCFVLDLVEYLARCKGGTKSCVLAPSIRRSLGIGNSTGLGMTPFLINHPTLIHCWMLARETALLRVRQVAQASVQERFLFREFVQRAQINAMQWNSAHPLQTEKITALRNDLKKLVSHLEKNDLQGAYPWHELVHWSEQQLSLEGQEQLVSLMLEPYGELVDSLAETMHINEAEHFVIDADVTLATLREQMERHYNWVWNFDFDDKLSMARFWYVSEEKLEPRLGERYNEPGADMELPFHIARDAQVLYTKLSSYTSDTPLYKFLQEHPDLRHLIRRVQQTARFPYSEIQDNLVDAQMLPINMLRCKLSFFGVTRFDPRSDRWLRICMYQNAPFPHELETYDGDDWAYPR